MFSFGERKKKDEIIGAIFFFFSVGALEEKERAGARGRHFRTESMSDLISEAVVVAQSLSRVRVSVTPWTAALQASLPFT